MRHDALVYHFDFPIERSAITPFEAIIYPVSYNLYLVYVQYFHNRICANLQPDLIKFMIHHSLQLYSGESKIDFLPEPPKIKSFWGLWVHLNWSLPSNMILQGLGRLHV